MVASWQLGGFTEAMLRWRVDCGRLYRVQPLVFSLTPRVLPRGRMLAAALTFGPEAVLSHRSAAAIWDLGPWPTGLIDVTLPGRRKPRRGIRLHRARVERVVRDGFPVTTVARTLVDLAAVLPFGRLRDAFERAERLRLLDAFEQALRTLCRDYDIPLPSQNVVLAGYEVDAFWEPNLVVELDGWEWHKTRRAFEEDRRKAAALEAAGYRVVRFTWRHIQRERDLVAAAIRSGCPIAAGRGRAPARAGARLPSVPSA